MNTLSGVPFKFSLKYFLHRCKTLYGPLESYFHRIMSHTHESRWRAFHPHAPAGL